MLAVLEGSSYMCQVWSRQAHLRAQRPAGVRRVRIFLSRWTFLQCASVRSLARLYSPWLPLITRVLTIFSMSFFLIGWSQFCVVRVEHMSCPLYIGCCIYPALNLPLSFGKRALYMQ